MSKHNNRNIVNGITRATELPIEALVCSPLFQLYSDKELVIEGAKNLEYYDEKCVKVQLVKMSVSINGKDLHIKCLANKNLSVSGTIDSILFTHYSN